MATKTATKKSAAAPPPVAPALKLDTPQKIFYAAPEDLETSLKLNPVRRFDAAGEDYVQLKHNIAIAGQPYGKVGKILQPITVRKNPEYGKVDGAKQWVVEGGHQRTRIARELNKNAKSEEAKMQIPCIEEKDADLKSVIQRQISENVRTDWSLVDRANAAVELLKAHDGSDGSEKLTQGALAKMLGTDEAMISNYLAVINFLTKDQLMEVHENAVPWKAAVRIARIKDKEARKATIEAAKAAKAKAKAEAEAKKSGSKAQKKKAGEKAGNKAAEEVARQAAEADKKKRREKGDTPTGRPAKKNVASESAPKQNGPVLMATANDMYDLCISEFSLGAQGEPLKDIGEAICRYFRSKNETVFVDEMKAILSEIKGS